MRRSARAVHAAIAEACGRKVAGRSNADPLRVLAIGSGELHELDSDLQYRREVGYLDSTIAEELLAEVGEVRKMLAALIAHRRSSAPPDRNRGLPG
jgi:four helix bundle protein